MSEYTRELLAAQLVFVFIQRFLTLIGEVFPREMWLKNCLLSASINKLLHFVRMFGVIAIDSPVAITNSKSQMVDG